jgi:hypothetical protein
MYRCPSLETGFYESLVQHGPCRECDALQMGMSSRVVRLPATATQADLHKAIDDACHDGSIDGVLVQLPLPPHLDEFAIMERIDPRKDVDGFHPLNMGRMIARGAAPRFVPATALGCIQLLKRYNIDVKVWQRLPRSWPYGTAPIVSDPVNFQTPLFQRGLGLCTQINAPFFWDLCCRPGV